MPTWLVVTNITSTYDPSLSAIFIPNTVPTTSYVATITFGCTLVHNSVVVFISVN